MQLESLKARARRRRLPSDLGERQAIAVAAKVLNRTCAASALNRQMDCGVHMCSDTAGRLYVAAVIDLFSRCVVGWSKSAAMTAELVRSGNVWDKAAIESFFSS
jgi:putative transposase